MPSKPIVDLLDSPVPPSYMFSPDRTKVRYQMVVNTPTGKVDAQPAASSELDHEELLIAICRDVYVRDLQWPLL